MILFFCRSLRLPWPGEVAVQVSQPHLLPSECRGPGFRLPLTSHPSRQVCCLFWSKFPKATVSSVSPKGLSC